MSGTAPDTDGTNGTATAAAPVHELTAKERRAAREEARRQVVAAEKARLQAAALAKDGKAPPATASAPAAPVAPVEPLPPDAVLVGWVAVFLRGVLYPVLSLGARLFRGSLDLRRYDEARAKAEAAAWVPLLKEYGWLRGVVKWTTVPAQVVATVRDLFNKAKPAEEAKP
jgi:hypothetical protein